jgi:hypothetical protein
MRLRGLIVGIAVCFSATIFASSAWSKNQPNRATPPYDSSYTPPYDSSYTPSYDQVIRKSLERLSPPERLVIKSILTQLARKSSDEILSLKLETEDICQEIECLGASPTTVRRYVEAYAEQRAANDAHQTALRSAAAAERSTFIAAMAAGVSFLSMLISALTYRHTLHSTKSAIPA